MAKLSQQQIAQLAANAGMADPITMSAIAMAESSGITTRLNPIPPDLSYGLWQINMYGANGPARRREFGISKNSDLYDPNVNAAAAAKILASQGLSAWSTYTTSDPLVSYKRFLPKTDANGQAVQAGWWGDFWDGFKKGFDVGPGPEDLVDGGMGNDPSITGGLGDVATGLGGITEAVQKTARWVGNAQNWVRVGYVIGGGLLVAIGLVIVARPVLQGTPVAAAAKKASTAVKAAKASKKAAPKKAAPKEKV